MTTPDSAAYHNEDAARERLENLRWPDGPICPHCGSLDNAHKMTGASTRPGLYKCRDCRKPFSVTIGTLFERSKIPLSKWVYASDLLASSKKGVSAHQIHRTLKVTYKTAWFMMHRLREAMRPLQAPKLGGPGKIVEADETYVGRKVGAKKKQGWGHKNAVFSLVERGGKVHSVHVTGEMFDAVKHALADQVHAGSILATDEAKMYRTVGKRFAAHEAVNHGVGEYVRGRAHTNTLESYFSVFKRGMTGVYQHCKEDHLHRYLFEFDFRYNHRIAAGVNDAQRSDAILEGISHKRLTYRRPGVH